MKQFFSKYKIWIVCLLMAVFITIFRPVFLTSNNIYGILTSMIPNGVAAIGLMFGLIAGVINISIGAVMALSAVVFALAIPHVGVIPALLLGLLCGAAVGVIDGYLVAYRGMNPWLVAAALNISVKGLAVLISGSEPVTIANPLFEIIALATIGPVPALFILFAAVVAVVDIVLHHTQFGRNMYAVGGGADIAQACGIDVKKYKMAALTVSSTLAGLGGMLLTTRIFSANGNLGATAVSTCLPMVIIGGSSINGGKGGALKTVSGCLVMVLITNFMNLFNIYINVQTLVQGLLLLTIVVLDKYFINKTIKV